MSVCSDFMPSILFFGLMATLKGNKTLPSFSFLKAVS